MTAAVLEFPPDLPISEWADEIVDALTNHQVLVVAGETGSGKTTQLPKMCLRAGRRRIAHTQPRRLAARTVAERIASEMQVDLGTDVGYQVRFTRKATRDTAVTVMTDGVLLNAISHDRQLRRYDTIIIDEAHERSLNIDFLLGYLKQLLPHRPDLRVIVTSATIDTARFAAHFDDCPVVEVSGRTYPVEVRYRPVEVESGVRDQNEAIAEAVAELAAEPPGDVLVFLSGEREIRDAADHLASLDLPLTEVLPLYARLSAAEQHRVFASHAGRRIVLATNVAETSLTVPGIRYVVDVGAARISRYSAKTKVQRLPIEPISQASANQRAGRCGRVAPGVAIRLYSEEDFAARLEFTEPEILRTNLAAVILQMADAKLGDIRDFPFVEAPDAAQINDGLRLLDELGALSSGKSATPRLTEVGHQLAKIPVDPRLGRMLIEADRRSCLREVLAITAGLSIQDPREFPEEKREQATASHRRFAHPKGADKAPPDSDFLAIWRLWRHLQRSQRQLSGNAFRRMCRDEFLHYLRIREWQDLHSQLTQVARDLHLRPNDRPADPDDIHAALLAGLLSHVGLKEEREQPTRGRRLGPRTYLGARGARFAIQRGSALASQPPDLVMAYELVETTRLWARTLAPITAEMAEDIGAHLIKRSYSEPHWSSALGQAMAYERLTLLGTPIVAGRRVGYAKVDPAEARRLFIRSALVEGDWHTRHGFFERNAQVRADAEEMETRTRRHDIISDAALFDFYDARIPAEVVSQTHFDSWWRHSSDPHLLDLSLAAFTTEAADDFDAEAFPDVWVVGEHSFELDYRFDPGEAADGVSVRIPLAVLNQISADELSWHVPGLRLELATELIRTLAKPLRRHFAPAPDSAARALAWLDDHPERRQSSLAASLAVALTQLKHPVAATDFRPHLVPGHLATRIEVVDGDDVVAAGTDLDALADELRGHVTEQLTQAAPEQQRSGATRWEFGAIAEQTEVAAGETTLRGFPGLVDEGATVGLRVFESAASAQAHHERGVRRLATLALPDPTRWVVSHLSMADKVALGTSPYAAVPDLIADARLAGVGDFLGDGIRDEDTFRRRCEAIRADVPSHVAAQVALAAEVLRRDAALREALAALQDSDARRDLAEQRAGLVFAGFIAATPLEHRRHLPRYLSGARLRAEQLRADPDRHADHLETITDLEDEYARLCAAQRSGPLPAAVADVGWALEELRISLFAQQLGTSRKVSAKRVRSLLREAAAVG